VSYDFVVVGAGMAGAVFAREMTDRGRKVLVLDSADTVGGACASTEREGIHVHLHGPHVFHTSDLRIWKYIHRFADFMTFNLRMKSMSRGKLYSFPVNLMTLNQLWGVVTPEQARARLDREREKIENPRNLEEWALSQMGRELYEMFFYGYTIKQWGRDPKDLPSLIIRRIPLRFNFNDNHFFTPYQGQPVGGYSRMFEKILEGIEVRLGVDYIHHKSEFDKLGQVVYTGRLDRFFDYCFGTLDFRTVRFEIERHAGDFQGCPVVTYPDIAIKHTRITEHKHFEMLDVGHTFISREFAEEATRESPPYYPINDEKNNSLAKKYLDTPTKAIFLGRAARYQYLDMDQAIAQALSLVARLDRTK
jgi:UDP-galactopyranose mutase